jgi:CAF1 family ribonuclease
MKEEQSKKLAGTPDLSVANVEDCPSDLEKMEQECNIEALFQSEFGFTRVIEVLSKHAKFILGHNMLLDLGFLYR